jgi:hypothetical protein
MYRVSLVAFLVLSIPVSLRSQSEADLGAKYPVIKAYEVRPGIVMTPLYASEGQVCELALERHTTNTKTKITLSLDSFLSRETVKELVDELAPPSVRGKELTGFGSWFGSVTIDGPFVVTKYEYENILVEVNGVRHESGPSGDLVVIIKWRKKACPREGHSSPPTPNSNADSMNVGAPAKRKK